MNYSLVSHRLWQGGTGKQILDELGDAGMVVAIYLMTSPHANQSGVFHCPIQYIAVETNRSAEEVESCLVGLERIGFSRYDYESGVVWVRNMVKFQVQNWPVEKKDHRRRGVLNALTSVPKSYLVNEFLEHWGIEHSTDSTVGSLPRDLEGACKGLPNNPIKIASGGVA
ncbi:MAG: hypothetical protein KZQ92_16215 [Candidatus Thiodiazotropha sp. (ex Lucinoma borealis)]|nr:hypothetical protein [Candidatus Thiodiazotropha sp. (ex Lucinoma borealis)]